MAIFWYIKILNGDSRIVRHTSSALKEVEKTLNDESIETKTIAVGNKDIRGYIACMVSD